MVDAQVPWEELFFHSKEEEPVALEEEPDATLFRADSATGRIVTDHSRAAVVQMYESAGVSEGQMSQLAASTEWSQVRAVTAALPEEVQRKIELVCSAKAEEVRGRLSREERIQWISSICAEEATVHESYRQLKAVLEKHPPARWSLGDPKLGVLADLRGFRIVCLLFLNLSSKQQLSLAHTCRVLRDMHAAYLKLDSSVFCRGLVPFNSQHLQQKSKSEIQDELQSGIRRLHSRFTGSAGGRHRWSINLHLRGITTDLLATINACGLKLEVSGGMELRHVPIDVKSDPSVVLAAVQNNPWAFFYLSPAFKSSEDFLRTLEEQLGSEFMPFFRCVAAVPEQVPDGHWWKGKMSRIQKEVRVESDQADIPFLRSLVPVGADLSELQATFVGPPGTPYAGGVFRVRMPIGDYPMAPPIPYFVTKVLSPYVRNGRLSPHWFQPPEMPLSTQPSQPWPQPSQADECSFCQGTGMNGFSRCTWCPEVDEQSPPSTEQRAHDASATSLQRRPSVRALPCQGVLDEANPNVYVHTLTGKMITISATSSMTVDVLKAKIRDKEGVPPSQQRLMFEGKEIAHDTCTLEQYGIQPLAKFHLELPNDELNPASWSPAMRLAPVLRRLVTNFFLGFQSADVEALWGSRDGLEGTEDMEDAERAAIVEFTGLWHSNKEEALRRIEQFTAEHAQPRRLICGTVARDVYKKVSARACVRAFADGLRTVHAERWCVRISAYETSSPIYDIVVAYMVMTYIYGRTGHWSGARRPGVHDCLQERLHRALWRRQDFC